jgi:hypothetical protein
MTKDSKGCSATFEVSILDIDLFYRKESKEWKLNQLFWDSE